ncbi:MAG: hypothetical protein KDA69_03325 [Planctomycetaceae bacterium]|nr:hypothetical protein [Planctomycetaceae bacterium]
MSLSPRQIDMRLATWLLCHLVGVVGWVSAQDDSTLSAPNGPADGVSVQDVTQKLEDLGYRVIPADTEESASLQQRVALETLLRTPAAELVDAAQGASFATVNEAVFEATVLGEEMRSGQFSCTVQHLGVRRASLNWTDTNIAIHSLSTAHSSESGNGRPVVSSDTVPAIWGTSPDGRILVFIDEDQTKLTGRWSAHGKTLGRRPSAGSDSTEATFAFPSIQQFQLTFPPALNTQIRLRVPNTKRLKCPVGLLRGPDAAEAGWSIWTLDLGRRRDARIQVEPTSLGDDAALYGNLETAYSANKQGLRIQADAELMSFTSDARTVQVQVPRQLKVQNVTLNSVAVPFHVEEGNPARLDVSIGELSAGQIAQLRIHASAPLSWGLTRALPKLRIPDAVVLSERVTLVVEPPLAAESLSTDQMLQTALSTESVGEVWTFQSLSDDSRINVKIRESSSQLNVDSTTVVSLQSELLTAITRLDLQNRVGKTYQLECVLPADWSVLDVSSGGRNGPTHVERVEGVNRHVRLELIDPVGGETPQSVFLTLRRVAPPLGESWAFPVVQPQESHEFNGVCYFVSSQGLGIETDGDNALEADLVPTDVPESLWKKLVAVSPQLTVPGEDVTALRWKSPSVPPATIHLTEYAARTTPVGDEAALNGDANSVEQATTESSANTSTLSGVVQMELSTVLSSRNGGQHVSRATYHFSQPRDVSKLQLSLPEGCVVSSVVRDGQSVTVLRRGERISFPKRVEPAKTIEILYLLPSRGGLLSEEVDIPLPLNGEPIEQMHWSIDGAFGHRIEVENSADAVGITPNAFRITSRLLGPLARFEGSKWFNPVRPQDWTSIWEGAAPTSSSHANVTLTLGKPGDSLRLRYWKSRQFQAVAWVVLLFCGLVGVAVRMWNLTRLRRLAIALLLMLGAAAILLPDEPALIAGGGFIGAVLSLLFPRQYVRHTDLLKENSVIAAAQQATGPSSVLTRWLPILLVALLWMHQSSGVVAQNNLAEPPTVRLELEDETIIASTSNETAGLLRRVRDESPSYLISAIEYDVLESKPLSIRADIRVRVLDPVEAQYVSLPFAGIVLRNGANCLVDDQPTELIPASSGDALLVPLPQGTNVRRHRITLEFGLRPDAEVEGVRLPRVVAATLRTPAGMSPLSFVHQGMVRQMDGEGTLTFLGSIERLALPQTNSVTASSGLLSSDMQVVLDRRKASAVCNLNVQLDEAFPPSVELLLPHGSRLQQIVSPDLQSYDVVRNRRTGTWLHIELQRHNANLTLQYQVPVKQPEGGSILLPPLLAAPQESTKQMVRLSASAGMLISNVSADDDTTGTVAAESDPNGVWTIQDANLNSLRVDFTDVPSRAKADILERITVTREEAQYGGTIVLDSMTLPQFVHQLKLPLDWHVQDIQIEQSGVSRNVRWSREGSRITVFVPDAATGKRTLHVRGARPIQSEVWEAFPEIEVLDAAVGERQLLVNDATRWSVEVATAGGTVMATSPRKAGTTSDQEEDPTPVLSFSSSAEPQQFRIVPSPEAARADSVTMLQPDEDGQWRVTQQLHIESLEAKFRQIRLKVPSAIAQQLSISPATLRPSVGEDDGAFTKVTLDVPQRWRDEVSLSISWLTANEELLSVGLANCVVESAAEVSHFVVLPAEAGLQVAPRSGRSVSGASLPRWTPVRWTNLVRQREALCYQVVEPVAQFESQSSDPTAGHIPWAEQLVWIHPDGSSHGELRLWGHCHENFTLELINDGETSIDEIQSVSEAKIRLDKEESSGAQKIEVSDSGGVFDIVVFWHKDKPSQAVISVPQLKTVAPEQMLTTVVATEPWQLVNTPETYPLSLAESCIAQWNGYLDCLDESVNSIPVTSSILDRVRTVQQKLDSLLPQLSAEEAELIRTETAQLETRWRALQQRIPISVPESTPRVRHVSNDEPMELGSDQLVTRLHTNRPLTSLELQPVRRSQIDWQRVGFVTLLLLAVMVKVLISRRVPLREWFAVHPSLALATFGVVWWTWLSPSALGFVIFLLGGVRYLVDQRLAESSDLNTGPDG